MFPGDKSPDVRDPKTACWRVLVEVSTVFKWFYGLLLRDFWSLRAHLTAPSKRAFWSVLVPFFGFEGYLVVRTCK